MKSVYNFTREEYIKFFLSINETKFRAKQMFNAIYKNKAKSFDDITTFNKELRDKLSGLLSFDTIKELEVQESDKTHKYLFELEDGNVLETVLMKQVYGNSLCVTTQVGCNMGCEFCASGQLSKVRDLTAAEMVMQILAVEESINERISHVVIMGIGEPFDNFANVVEFLKIINDDHGLGIGARHITVSTSGVAPKIIEFANLNLQVNLAISLHASTNAQRNKIMPINNKYDLEALKKALYYYCDNTNRRLTIEYVMIDGFNDSVEDAKQLVKYLRGLHYYINLIPLNSVDETKYKASTKENLNNFLNYLETIGVNVRVRQEFGQEISAACGQLRSKHKGV